MFIFFATALDLHSVLMPLFLLDWGPHGKQIPVNHRRRRDRLKPVRVEKRIETGNSFSLVVSVFYIQ